MKILLEKKLGLTTKKTFFLGPEKPLLGQIFPREEVF